MSTVVFIVLNILIPTIRKFIAWKIVLLFAKAISRACRGRQNGAAE